MGYIPCEMHVDEMAYERYTPMRDKSIRWPMGIHAYGRGTYIRDVRL
jgi:hypothetical protein